MVLQAKYSAAPVFLENTDEVSLWEVASLSTAVWVFGVPRNRGSMECLSVLCPEKCNSEEVCVHRKIAQRVLLVWLIIVSQRRKKKLTPWLYQQIIPIQQVWTYMFWVCKSSPFQTVMHDSCAPGFLAEDVKAPGSILSLRGVPYTLNFHLHNSVLISRLCSGRRLLFRESGEDLCEGLES